MPDLPTITVSAEHFNRLVAAFPGTTNAEKAAAYKAWLINRLIERVEAVERNRIDEEMNDERIAALEALTASLPDRLPEPEMPHRVAGPR